MRITIIFLFTVFMSNFSLGQTSQSFTVKGFIKNATGKELVLYNSTFIEKNEEKTIEKSIVLPKDGAFEFKFTDSELGMYVLTIPECNNDILFTNNEKDTYIEASVESKKLVINQKLVKRKEFEVHRLNQELEGILKGDVMTTAMRTKVKNILLKYYNNTNSPAVHLYIFTIAMVLKCFDNSSFDQLLAQSIQKYPNHQSLKLFPERVNQLRKEKD